VRLSVKEHELIKSVHFGFLPEKWTIEFSAGKITPIPEFDRVSKAVQKRLNKDGFLYPPTSKTVTIHPGGRKTAVPKTKRPAFLYPVPPSHELDLKEPNSRDGAASFIIHCLGFLFGTRLQFADYFIDGRIHLGIQHQICYPAQASWLLSRSFKTWSAWSENDKRRFTNILYMHSRASAYEWDWEEFIIQYMVLDGCWKMAETLFGLRARNHLERIQVLCRTLKIELDKNFIDLDAMVRLRHDLFHETLWFGARPCSTIGHLPYHMPTRMGILNHQLIAALLQIESAFH
jgi:hypothetical protein